jgi:glyoxylase-like metal-dependent hydrolase (beta-lactamase superfamily II)
MNTSGGTSIRLGELTIDRIEEFSAPVLPPDGFLVGLPPGAAQENQDWMAPHHYDPGSGLLVMADHTWVVRTPDTTILIDTCWGNGKDRPGFGANLDTDWLQDLESLGIGVDDVDFVICTHLHSDHVGWNTISVDGEWVPTFRNARYLITREEYEYWSKSEISDFGHDKAFVDSVLPLEKAGLLDLVEPGEIVAGCLTLLAAPGHSPGHVAIRAESAGEIGVFAGDAIHVPLQLAYPDAGSVACVDLELSRQTRRSLLEDCADNGYLLLTNHFPRPSAVYIKRVGDHFAMRGGIDE